MLTACATTPLEEETVVDIPTKTQGFILALWDSLTAWLGLAELDAYPAQLQSQLQSLGYKYTVQNAWVSWDTSAWLLARMDWLLEGNTPSLAILCIGANDAFQGKSVADIENNIRSILDKLKAKNIPVLLAGMKAPFNLWAEYRTEYDAVFEKIATEYDIVYMPFFLDGVALDAKLNQADRIHPTKEGYAIIVENLLKILEDEELVKK
jgi:acyl-CoA thioesterase I